LSNLMKSSTVLSNSTVVDWDSSSIHRPRGTVHRTAERECP
jgi:hypothetical protein